MSPEQARGRDVDKRTDVWAFGAVLYEMLTGARAFDGEDVTEMMASVVKSTPNWADLPAEVPPHVVTLIKRCLEKDRKARAGDIAVARFLLSDGAALGATSSASARRTSAREVSWRPAVPWVAGALAIGALVGWLVPRSRSGAPARDASADDCRARGLALGSNISGSMRPAAPRWRSRPTDGAWCSAVRANRGNVRAATLRSRSSIAPRRRRFRGRKAASAPFFSPDGAWIGFWVGNTIRKMPASGRAVRHHLRCTSRARLGRELGRRRDHLLCD